MRDGLSPDGGGLGAGASGGHSPARRADRLILRGYGPLAGLLALLLLVTMLVPSRSRPGTEDGGLLAQRPAASIATSAVARTESQAGAVAGSGTGVGAGPGPWGVAQGGPTRAPAASAAEGPAVPLVQDRADRPGRAVTSGAGTGSGGGVGSVGSPVPGGVRRAANCSGGELQDANTGYSPPCLAFTGPNGGGTARGVAADTITVAVREAGHPFGGEGSSELEKVAQKRGIIASPEQTRRQREAFLAYLNSRYQLYGRKVKIVTYQGRGSNAREITGTGQEAANADALKVGQEIKAFADLSAITQPYLEALVRQKVVAVGGLHMPASYYRSRAPYAWGQFIDCTTLTASAADLLAKRLPPGGTAARAGSAALRGEPRKYGLIVPDDAVYAQCVAEARPKLKAAGITIAKEIKYGLGLAAVQSQTPNIAAQLKAAGITTVLLVTDPTLPLFLSASATQQDYWPEWFLSGTIFTDYDLAGQFADQDQWRHAIGQSFGADFLQGKASESWRAFRAIRPGEEPTIARDIDYYPLLLLFIGLQMAGPNLTPVTFQQGLFAYGPHRGALGTWSWGPDDYTAVDDAREIYWDPTALSPTNNQPGHYVVPPGTRRHRGTDWPARDPGVPIPPPSAP